MKTVTVTATFELPEEASYEELLEFFEFEFGKRCVLSGSNPLSSQDLPTATSVDLKDW